MDHPDYDLVILDNRDEVWDRPTAPAHWWPGTSVYAPQDLQRSEHGTWMGVSRGGRVSVLVNVAENQMSVAKLSRGTLPSMFLESSLGPTEWIGQMRERHKHELDDCGGFTMLLYAPGHDMAIFSNRAPDQTGLRGTFSVSNGPNWPKSNRLVKEFNQLQNIKGPEFLDHARALLRLRTDNRDPPRTREELKYHIYIEPFELHDQKYGTRTSTVILVGSDEVVYDETDVATDHNHIERFKIDHARS